MKAVVCDRNAAFSQLQRLAYTEYGCYLDIQEQTTMESESKELLTQTYESFVNQFQLAANEGISENSLHQLRNDYWTLLMPIEGEALFPLEKLRSEEFYKPTISKLISSKDPNQRVLAYITIASAGDQSFKKGLRAASRREKTADAKGAATLALLSLKDRNTSDLFERVVRNEDFWKAHFGLYYLQLDKAALLKTAYQKIFLQNSNAKNLALISLTLSRLTPKADILVREAMRSSDPTVKQTALYAMKRLRMGNLRELLLPLLSCSDDTLRSLAFAALANSPAPEDRNCLDSFTKSAPLSADVLNGFLESDDVENVRQWLVLVRDYPVPIDYYFSTPLHPLLSADALLHDVRTTVGESANRHIVAELLRALDGRNDNETVDLLIAFLSDSDSAIRYCAAWALKSNTSAKLVEQLPGLIRNTALRTTALTECAIANKLDGLHDVYKEFLQPGTDAGIDWARSASDYLATFPRKEDGHLFKSILERGDEDIHVRWNAARGLGELRDSSSVDLLIGAIRETAHDSHAIDYLEALGKIKGQKAKVVLKSFEASKVSNVRKLVTGILNRW